MDANKRELLLKDEVCRFSRPHALRGNGKFKGLEGFIIGVGKI